MYLTNAGPANPTPVTLAQVAKAYKEYKDEMEAWHRDHPPIAILCKGTPDDIRKALQIPGSAVGIDAMGVADSSLTGLEVRHIDHMGLTVLMDSRVSMEVRNTKGMLLVSILSHGKDLAPGETVSLKINLPFSLDIEEVEEP